MRAAAAIVPVMVVCSMFAGVPAAGAQGLGYGARAGMNLGDLHTVAKGEVTPFDVRPGLVVGGFVTWPLGGRLELQPEVLFTQKGAKFARDGTAGTLKLEYVDVPLLASYRLFGAPRRHLSVVAGPAVGLRVRAKSSVSFGGDTLEQDVSDEVKRSDLGIVGGLAYHLGRLSLDGRYSWGLSDVDQLTDDDVKVRNRGIAFTAGWMF